MAPCLPREVSLLGGRVEHCRFLRLRASCAQTNLDRPIRSDQQNALDGFSHGWWEDVRPPAATDETREELKVIQAQPGALPKETIQYDSRIERLANSLHRSVRERCDEMLQPIHEEVHDLKTRLSTCQISEGSADNSSPPNEHMELLRSRLEDVLQNVLSLQSDATGFIARESASDLISVVKDKFSLKKVLARSPEIVGGEIRRARAPLQIQQRIRCPRAVQPFTNCLSNLHFKPKLSCCSFSLVTHLLSCR